MIYDTLGEAISEVNEIFEKCPLTPVSAIIVKTKDESPYWPVYIMPRINRTDSYEVEEVMEKTIAANNEVVAVFATIR